MKALFSSQYSLSLLGNSSWFMCFRQVDLFQAQTTVFKVYTESVQALPSLSFLFVSGILFVCDISQGAEKERERKPGNIMIEKRRTCSEAGGCHVYIPSGIRLPSELKTQAGPLSASLATDHFKCQIMSSRSDFAQCDSSFNLQRSIRMMVFPNCFWLTFQIS